MPSEKYCDSGWHCASALVGGPITCLWAPCNCTQAWILRAHGWYQNKRSKEWHCPACQISWGPQYPVEQKPNKEQICPTCCPFAYPQQPLLALLNQPAAQAAQAAPAVPRDPPPPPPPPPPPLAFPEIADTRIQPRRRVGGTGRIQPNPGAAAKAAQLQVEVVELMGARGDGKGASAKGDGKGRGGNNVEAAPIDFQPKAPPQVPPVRTRPPTPPIPAHEAGAITELQLQDAPQRDTSTELEDAPATVTEVQNLKQTEEGIQTDDEKKMDRGTDIQSGEHFWWEAQKFGPFMGTVTRGTDIQSGETFAQNELEEQFQTVHAAVTVRNDAELAAGVWATSNAESESDEHGELAAGVWQTPNTRRRQQRERARREELSRAGFANG